MAAAAGGGTNSQIRMNRSRFREPVPACLAGRAPWRDRRWYGNVAAVSVSPPPALGSSGQVLTARVSIRLCTVLALCWALPGTVIGGYIAARYLTAGPAAPGGGAVTGAGLQVLPRGSAPSVSFVFLLVLLSAVLLLAPLAFAGLIYLRGAPAPGRRRWRAAWLGAIAAGAAAEASWLWQADQQTLRDLAPGTIPPWSSLSMLLGHLAVGIAMLVILRGASRQRG